MSKLGRTKTGNWVEERAVREKGYCEPMEFKMLNRLGHQDIMINDKRLKHGDSTQRTDFVAHERVGHNGGPRSRSTEDKFVAIAKAEFEAEQIAARTQESSNVSVTQRDFIDHSGKANNWPTMSTTSSTDQVGIDEPLSFWHDHRYAVPHSKEVIESAPFKRCHDFSKPINEFHGGPVKDF